MEVEQRLGLYHGDLVGVGRERVNMQFVATGFEIHIAERLEFAGFQIGELHEYAPVAGETLEVRVALLIEVAAHFLDLEIGHVTDAAAEGAFVSAGAAELESFDQAAIREHLARSAYDFGQTYITGEDAYNMRASCDPDNGFVLLGLELAICVDLE